MDRKGSKVLLEEEHRCENRREGKFGEDLDKLRRENRRQGRGVDKTLLASY
jgi:hypothetical protein